MNNVFERIQTMLQEAGTQAYDKMMEILPDAVLAIGIVIIGYLAASIIYFLIVRFLAFFAVDKLAGKTPLDRMLKNAGVTKSISEIIALLVFWMALLITLILAADVLELEQVSNALAIVTRYIPQVIAALLIVVFGMLLAKFLQTVVVQAVMNAAPLYAKHIGKVVHLIVLIFVLLAASEQLGLDLSFITTNVMIGIFALLVIFGVGLMVAARTVLENFLACRELRSHLSVGQHVDIADVSGSIREFTLTSILIEQHGKQTVLPATLFFKNTYTVSKGT